MRAVFGAVCFCNASWSHNEIRPSIKNEETQEQFQFLFETLQFFGALLSLEKNNGFNWKLWSYGECCCSATTDKPSGVCFVVWVRCCVQPTFPPLPFLSPFPVHWFLPPTSHSSLPRMSALFMQLPNKPNPGVSTGQRAAGRSGRQWQAESDPTGCLHLQSGGFSDHLEKKLQSHRPKGQKGMPDSLLFHFVTLCMDISITNSNTWVCLEVEDYNVSLAKCWGSPTWEWCLFPFSLLIFAEEKPPHSILLPPPFLGVGVHFLPHIDSVVEFKNLI